MKSERIIGKIILEVLPMADYSDVVFKASDMARSYNCFVEFEFNGNLIALNKDTDLVRLSNWFHSLPEDKHKIEEHDIAFLTNRTIYLANIITHLERKIEKLIEVTDGK